jgi:hypothetical protein
MIQTQSQKVPSLKNGSKIITCTIMTEIALKTKAKRMRKKRILTMNFLRILTMNFLKFSNKNLPLLLLK